MRCRTPHPAVGFSAARGYRSACRPISIASAWLRADDPLACLAADAFEHPQRPSHRYLAELAGIGCPAINVVRRLPAVIRVGEHVVNDETPAKVHPLRPSVEVAPRSFFGVATVNEQEL